MERIEVDGDDLSAMKLRFPISVTPGKVIFEMEDLSKSYGNKEVLNGVDIILERDSNDALVGYLLGLAKDFAVDSNLAAYSQREA